MITVTQTHLKSHNTNRNVILSHFPNNGDQLRKADVIISRFATIFQFSVAPSCISSGLYNNLKRTNRHTVLTNAISTSTQYYLLFITSGDRAALCSFNLHVDILKSHS